MAQRLSLVPTRVLNMRTVCQALTNDQWEQDIIGDTPFMALIQRMHLRAAIAGVHRDHLQPDVFTCPCDRSGKYTASSVYQRLCIGLIRSPTYECIWRSGAILKCKIFVWLAVQYRLWTSDRRARHGMQDDTVACFLCLQEEDTVDHILVHYSYAKEVWHLCFTKVGVDAPYPEHNETFTAWWLRARQTVITKHRRGFDTMVIAIAWSVWKQRNARVFGHLEQQRISHLLVDQIMEAQGLEDCGSW